MHFVICGLQVRMKACFDYNPFEDPYTPCPEASLAFTKGQVLTIVNQEDAWFWQAKLEGEENTARAGIIPSRLLAEKYAYGFLKTTI